MSEVRARFRVPGRRAPVDARPAGYEADGTVLYLARARLEGGLLVGKWRADWIHAAIPQGGFELWVQPFAVWVDPLPGDPAGEWGPAGEADAVVVGHDPDGTPLFAARALVHGGLHPGTWRAGQVHASIPYAGVELAIENFEVLLAR